MRRRCRAGPNGEGHIRTCVCAPCLELIWRCVPTRLRAGHPHPPPGFGDGVSKPGAYAEVREMLHAAVATLGVAKTGTRTPDTGQGPCSVCGAPARWAVSVRLETGDGQGLASGLLCELCRHYPERLEVLRERLKNLAESRADRPPEAGVSGPDPGRKEPGKVRSRIPQGLRREVLRQHNYTCAYCGRPGTETLGPDGKPWHVDHIVPLVEGGQTEPRNLVPACMTCNVRKGRRTDLKPPGREEYPEGLWGAEAQQ